MTLSFASITLDPLRCVASIAGVEVHLSPSEATIFGALINARGEAVSKRAIIDMLYRNSTGDVECFGNTVTAFIRTLRFKLTHAGFRNVIVTKFNSGYTFDVGADRTRFYTNQYHNIPLSYSQETIERVREMWMAGVPARNIAAVTCISNDQISRLRLKLSLPRRDEVLAEIAERNKPVHVPGRLDYPLYPLPAGHPYALAILREAGLPI